MNYNKISFEDEFEAEDEICEACGCDTMPRVGYNEDKDLLKFECPECGTVYIEDSNGKMTMIKGKKRGLVEILIREYGLSF